MTSSLSSDLNYILEHTKMLWQEFRDQSIFITGGTGFFGCWLLETLVWANTQLQLNLQVTVLTRDPSQFAKKCPHLYQQSCLHFYQGDVKDFTFPPGHFSYVIHGATDASASLNEYNPLLMFSTIIEGTKRTLEFAKVCQAKRILLVSSGAVYGRQPPDVPSLSEDFIGIPKVDDTKSAYAIGKYTAEHMACLYAKQYGLDIKIARCFAFVGPYLPLDIHFAIGNFIRDGLNGQDITVNGDGTPYRSYLYAADLVIWLLTILLQGKSLRPYNVGSDEALNIKEIANRVAHAFTPKLAVKVTSLPKVGVLPERYIPDIKRVKEELHLFPRISLDQAIQSTKRWHMAKNR